MRFYIPTHATPPQIVNALGSQFELTSITAKRRDAALHEVQFFDSYETPVSKELPGTAEVWFVAKRASDWQGDEVVIAQDYAWDAEKLAYVARPSYDTHGLTSVFVGALGFEVVTTDTTLASTHLEQLVVVNHASGRTITVAPALGSTTTDKIHIQRIGAGTVTIAPDSGVTINVSAGAALTVEERQVLTLSRTGINQWTLSVAEEEDEVTLMAEFTWRDAGDATSWTTVKKFDHVIENDVARGDEAAPTDPTAPTVYVTQAQLAAEVTSQIETQLGTPLGGMIPDASGNTLRGTAETVQALSAIIGNFPLTTDLDVFTGDDLQQDLITVDADSLTVDAMFDFIVEGVRKEAVDAEDGGYKNSLTIDAVAVIDMQREHVTDFAGKVLGYTITGQLAFSAIGASGRMHAAWTLVETDGTTIKTYSSRTFAAASTDTLALTVDTTTAFDLGIAAAYLTTDGQADHCIRLATLRRKL